MNIFKNGVGRPSNNIKRARMIIGAIALILSVAVGYALFSQTVTVQGTATASGSFSVVPTCKIAVGNDIDEDSEVGGDIAVFVSNPTCTVSGNEVTASVTLTQPGAYIYFLITQENTGTIDANLKNIVMSTSTSEAITKVEGSENIITTKNGMVSMALFDKNIANSDDDPITSLASGASHDYILAAAWDSEDTDSTVKTLNGTWTFNWEQVTN